MKVVFTFDVEIPEDKVKDMSELDDVVAYGQALCKEIIDVANSFDGLHLDIYATNGTMYVNRNIEQWKKYEEQRKQEKK